MDIKRIKTIYEQKNEVQVELVTVDEKEMLFIYDEKGFVNAISNPEKLSNALKEYYESRS